MFGSGDSDKLLETPWLDGRGPSIDTGGESDTLIDKAKPGWDGSEKLGGGWF